MDLWRTSLFAASGRRCNIWPSVRLVPPAVKIICSTIIFIKSIAGRFFFSHRSPQSAPLRFSFTPTTLLFARPTKFAYIRLPSPISSFFTMVREFKAPVNVSPLIRVSVTMDYFRSRHPIAISRFTRSLDGPTVGPYAPYNKNHAFRVRSVRLTRRNGGATVLSKFASLVNGFPKKIITSFTMNAAAARNA